MFQKKKYNKWAKNGFAPTSQSQKDSSQSGNIDS